MKQEFLNRFEYLKETEPLLGLAQNALRCSKTRLGIYLYSDGDIHVVSNGNMEYIGKNKNEAFNFIKNHYNEYFTPIEDSIPEYFIEEDIDLIFDKVKRYGQINLTEIEKEIILKSV